MIESGDGKTRKPRVPRDLKIPKRPRLPLFCFATGGRIPRGLSEKLDLGLAERVADRHPDTGVDEELDHEGPHVNKHGGLLKLVELADTSGLGRHIHLTVFDDVVLDGEDELPAHPGRFGDAALEHVFRTRTTKGVMVELHELERGVHIHEATLRVESDRDVVVGSVQSAGGETGGEDLERLDKRITGKSDGRAEGVPGFVGEIVVLNLASDRTPHGPVPKNRRPAASGWHRGRGREEVDRVKPRDVFREGHVQNGILLVEVLEILVLGLERLHVRDIVPGEDPREVHAILVTPHVEVAGLRSKRHTHGERLKNFFSDDLHRLIGVKLLVALSHSDGLRWMPATKETFFSNGNPSKVGRSFCKLHSDFWISSRLRELLDHSGPGEEFVAHVCRVLRLD